MMSTTNFLEMAKCDELLSTIYDLRDTMVNFAYYGTPTAKECWTTAQKHFQNLESHLIRRQQQQQQMRACCDHLTGADVVDVVVNVHDDHDTEGVADTFLMGTAPTAPDYSLYEMLDQYEMLAKEYDFASLDDNNNNNHPLLTTYKKTMEDWPHHDDYLHSFLHHGLPFNNPYALFASSLSAKSYVRGQLETPWRNLGIIIVKELQVEST